MSRLLFRSALVLIVTVTTVLLGRSFLVEPPAPAAAAPTVGVRVASTDLGMGVFVDEVDAPFRDWPKDELRADWTRSNVAPSDDIIGAVVIRPIQAGTPISREDLLMAGQDGFLAAVLDPGMRAVSVAVDAVSGNAGHVFPGDQVDLVLTQRLDGDGAREDWVSETILQSVRVIAVDQDLKEDLRARDGPADVPRTFTLEVTPADVERIAVASQLGQLSFSLRSLLAEQRPTGVHDARVGGTFGADVSQARRVPTTVEPTRAAPVKRDAPRVRVLRGHQTAVTAVTTQ